ncbi:hypothetical protein AS149_29680 [Burkholderia cenocepacia]|nr:hypothetical protein AS149_29680 [Burkholderia cenocepacia]
MPDNARDPEGDRSDPVRAFVPEFDANRMSWRPKIYAILPIRTAIECTVAHIAHRQVDSRHTCTATRIGRTKARWPRDVAKAVFALGLRTGQVFSLDRHIGGTRDRYAG